MYDICAMFLCRVHVHHNSLTNTYLVHICLYACVDTCRHVSIHRHIVVSYISWWLLAIAAYNIDVFNSICMQSHRPSLLVRTEIKEYMLPS